MRKQFVVWSIAVIVFIGLAGVFRSGFWWLYLLALPLIGVGIHDMTQQEHSLRRNFPLLSRGRWLLESLRPFLRQYLFESDTDGAPVSRMYRSVVYQRAKSVSDTVPFGTRIDTYADGYEWLSHSIGAVRHLGEAGDLRVVVGGPDCRQPYSASVLNISAMSFGALSPNAILALNRGAAAGGFAHNTGEGGVSRYHLEGGGDIIWQVGTGYFGCRAADGGFDAEAFRRTAALEQIRMIEIKLSQGAKPGHGGILPGVKNTIEIAAARGVEPGTTVDSPPRHKAFGTPVELLEFVQTLRELSDGKPIGFKLCVGRESEVVAICKAMVATGIRPDFITVDGGEGGTGAAPLEFTNSVGMPLRDALAFVCDCLTGFDLKRHIRVIASGRVFTAFDMARNMALGADMCNSARGFMLSLGCVQSLICNTNHCPTGIATQDPELASGLVVNDKSERVCAFHDETIARLGEMLAAAGLRSAADLNRTHVYRRTGQREIRRYDELFEYLPVGSLLEEPWPPEFQQQMAESSAETFLPASYVARHRGEGVMEVRLEQRA